ncbi:MAG: hypothetical protein OXN97_14465 [Bryobacterales bacterium]|nr:hypothetical protein [Bryobacterales bacterium]
METVVAWALMAGFVVSLIVAGVLLNRAMQFRHVTSTPVAVNDGHVTKDKFLELLEEARDSMIIYDDGDKVDGSIYMNQEVAESVQKKLDSDPSFHMQCLFNFDEPDLVFRKALQGSSTRVQIRTHDPRQPRLAIHYKIIDDGAKAYLSRHRPGETKRLYRIVDCTNVPKSHFKHVSDRVLRTYRNHFREAFGAAEARASI